MNTVAPGGPDSTDSPPVIGLVVPYAGRASLLRETVASVIQQSDPHWRLTVVEDGDQDPVVRPWVLGLNDPRVSYEQNPVTLGIAGNFQRCLTLARTEYVAFPGSDDRLRPDYVRVVRAAIAKHPRVALVQPGVSVIDADGRPVLPVADRVKSMLRPRVLGEATRACAEPLLASLMRGNWAYFPSICWRRELLSARGFRQDLATVLDLEMLGRLILDGADMLVLAPKVFEYRRHPASASSLAASAAERFVEERLVMDELAQVAKSRGWDYAARTASLRPSSRLHGALTLPTAVKARNWVAVRALVKHTFAA